MTREFPLTARGVARLQTLTDTAASLFLDQGYGAVSLDMLIARAGGSRRNIYQHFGGKEGLFIEVVTRLCEEQGQPLRDLDIEGDEIGEALTAFGHKVLEIVLQPRTLALHRLMIAEGQRFPALSQAILRSGHEAGVKTLAEWLRNRRCILRAELTPEVLAEQFVSLLITGPQLRALVGRESLPLSSAEIARLVRETVSAFLHGALKGGKSPDA
ncbi:TetR/AcrR family transcriptional regulator [Paenirhodobacter populi]|uniref:TetR/AcrR family transcriptional regulator n=1 Tax=Paenirhodobacter populi TaxID=2306993 RepID=UPI0019D48E31|nr:TetR/AcrR family transcriptional regulator [Sinirhodobacter populi]